MTEIAEARERQLTEFCNPEAFDVQW